MSTTKTITFENKKLRLFKVRYFLTLFILSISMTALANVKTQPKLLKSFVVSGKVTDDKGNAVPGVTVAVKGKSSRTTTDSKGYYSISIDDSKSILVFSSVGSISQEIPVGNNFVIDVVLINDMKTLGTIVVTGYSSQSKRDITGAVSVVNVKDLTSVPNANFSQQLQGKVAGVTVTTDGAPGGETIVRIRGIGSVTGSSDPLYIIDGVPTQGGIRQLNPNDIESMQILKDAASSSIYGSRASNGVIIITTIRGRGKPTLSFEAFTSIQTPQYERFPKFVSPLESAQFTWDAYLNAGNTPSSPVFGSGPKPVWDADYLINPTGNPSFVKEGNPLAAPSHYSIDPSDPNWQDSKYIIVKLNKQGTDWYRETFKSAIMQNYNLTASGSSDKSRFAVSAGYVDQNGIMVYTHFKRYSLRTNSEFTIGNGIRLGENLQLSFNNDNAPSRNSGIFSDVGRIFYSNPIQPVYDIGGQYTGTPNNYYWYHNPVAQQFYNKDNIHKESRVLGNVYLEADLLKGLTAKTSFGIDYNTRYSSDFQQKIIQELEASGNSYLSVNNSYATNWSWTNTLNYTKTIGEKHRFAIIAGSEAINNSARYDGIGAKIFASNDVSYRYLSAAEGFDPPYGSGNDSRLFSFFGKGDYVFDDKYILSATIRRDASSRFSPSKRWGTFPAASVGWRISKESFMQNVKLFDDLKLRASWGKTGNQNIGDYNQYSTYGGSLASTGYDINGTGNAVVSGYTRVLVGNPVAQWEAQAETNVGFDASMLNNKLSVTFDVYDRESSKLLMYVPHPGVDGEKTFPAENVGSVQNKGIDVQITYNNKHQSEKMLDYGISLNWSTFSNKVTALYGGDNTYINGVGNGYQGATSGNPTRTAVGYPISSYYGLIIDGIFQTQAEADAYPQQFGNSGLYNKPGRWKFRDVDGDGTIDATKDQTFIGNPNPKFTYGVNLFAAYKGFDINAFFQGVYGNKIFNSMKYWTDFVPTDISYAASVRVRDSWTLQNTGAKLPQLNNNAANGYETANSTYYVEDGSYLRCKNLQIGYSFPKSLLSKLKISKLRFYATGTNLFTLTNYTGIDPEVTVAQGSLLSSGVDQGVYPFARSYTFGLQLGL